MLPLRVRVDQGAMALKGYSTFPKAPALDPHHRIVLCHIEDTLWVEVLLPCKDAVGVFDIPSWLGWQWNGFTCLIYFYVHGFLSFQINTKKKNYSIQKYSKNYQKQIYSYPYHHHHHLVLLAWISLILSYHSSLSIITSGKISRLHPVSLQSCCR